MRQGCATTACAKIVYAFLHIVLALEYLHRHTIRNWIIICSCVFLLYHLIQRCCIKGRWIEAQNQMRLTHSPRLILVHYNHSLSQLFIQVALPRINDSHIVQCLVVLYIRALVVLLYLKAPRMLCFQ